MNSQNLEKSKNNIREASYTFDVYGLIVNQKSFTYRKKNISFAYILDPESKHNRHFHAGLFFSKSAFSDLIYRYPKSKRICVLSESSIFFSHGSMKFLKKRFSIIFTHQEYLLSQGTSFKSLLFGTNWIGVRTQANTEIILSEHPQKTRLVSFMGSLAHPNEGAYQFRREIANLCIDYSSVDCFGKGIKPVQGKREAIAPYRFSIAMENAASNYYFSEKLIDCLLLETIPIYYGCPGITELFDPKGLLIFNTKEELMSILDRLSPNLYDEMYPYLMENKHKAIQENWHSHYGLLSRLSAQIPSSYLNPNQLFAYRTHLISSLQLVV